MGWTALRTVGDRLVLKISTGVRVLFGALSALSLGVLLYGVLFEGEATLLLARNIVPFALLLACLWGTVQEDRWTFDRTAGSLESRYGLLFLAGRRRWHLADIERIEVDRFTRGSLGRAEGTASHAGEARAAPRGADPRASFLAGLWPSGRRGVGGTVTRPREWIRLLVIQRDGPILVLDSARSHRLSDFTNRGMRIASFCGVTFTGSEADPGR